MFLRKDRDNVVHATWEQQRHRRVSLAEERAAPYIQ